MVEGLGERQTQLSLGILTTICNNIDPPSLLPLNERLDSDNTQ